jgi:hypothetical protein
MYNIEDVERQIGKVKVGNIRNPMIELNKLLSNPMKYVKEIHYKDAIIVGLLQRIAQLDADLSNLSNLSNLGSNTQFTITLPPSTATGTGTAIYTADELRKAIKDEIIKYGDKIIGFIVPALIRGIGNQQTVESLIGIFTNAVLANLPP